MVYNKFAYIYDQLMEDAPYELWLKYMDRICNTYDRNAKTIIDVGCGTGSLAVPMAKSGYIVKGIDLSEDMLLVAQEKAKDNNVSIQFFAQDMCELDGFYPCDVITIFCDSLNYLESEAAVQKTFAAVYKNLSEGGLFLFDVHSIFKMEHIFEGETFALDDEDVSYIWECYKGEAAYSVEHVLSFFVRKQDNLYEKFMESHKQQTYPLEQYKTWLTQAGFEILEITADFTKDIPNNESERIFFACQKNNF